MDEIRTRSKYAGRHRPGNSGVASSARLSLLALAAAYTLFVIYGSLVPLDYRHHAWQEAVEAFKNIRHLNLGIGSRADWVANILLFVPLAFLWLGSLWHPRNIIWRIIATLGVLLTCVGLSLGIEFTQIFFPPRTVSQNDIYAESLGALIGVALWWMAGASATRWYLGWRAAEGRMALAQRLLYGYLFVLFGYNLLPLDLTISPVELFHKWSQGRIIFVPFTHQAGDWAQLAYGFLADVTVWVPAGLLALLTAKRSSTSNWLRLTAAAALLELLQLFVYTRVTDTTDIFTGSLGAALGVWLASRWHPAPASAPSRQKSLGEIAGLATASLLWLSIVFTVFWYPFNFQSDGMFVSSRLAEASSRVPFAAYYFGTEYRAITEVMHKVGFFFPLGMLLALLARQIRFGPPAMWKMAALASVAIVAGSVEAGQLFLPGKFADLTDWILEMAGGWAGWALAWRVRSMPTHQTPDVLVTPAPILPRPRHRPWLLAGALVLGLTLTLWTATHIPAVPYNIRDLIAREYPLWSAFLLACAVAWVFGSPALTITRMLANAKTPVSLPTHMLLHAIVAWVLLRLAVPLESIHDIVGSPVLDWPWEWELIGRFVGLFAFWSAIAFGSVLIALRPWIPGTGPFLGMWAMLVAVLLPISHIVVIQHAATDNITELVAGNGSPMAALWIAAGVFVISLAGSQLAVWSGIGLSAGVVRVAAWSVASFPLTYLALNAGFEPYIMKYEQVFSAFQFLLSQDRSHYATPTELLLRYGIAHTALLLVVATSQAPFLREAIRSSTRKGMHDSMPPAG